jgi:hypothetical protein
MLKEDHGAECKMVSLRAAKPSHLVLN